MAPSFARSWAIVCGRWCWRRCVVVVALRALVLPDDDRGRPGAAGPIPSPSSWPPTSAAGRRPSSSSSRSPAPRPTGGPSPTTAGSCSARPTTACWSAAATPRAASTAGSCAAPPSPTGRAGCQRGSRRPALRRRGRRRGRRRCAELVDGPQAALRRRPPASDGCWTLSCGSTTRRRPTATRPRSASTPPPGRPPRLEVRRPEAVDVVEAVEIRTTVTAEDLRPGDLGDLPGAER